MGQRPDDLMPQSAADDVWGPDPAFDPQTKPTQSVSRSEGFAPGSSYRVVATSEASPPRQPPEVAEQDVAELREGIEQTRSELGDTIDAIQDRLSPQQLADEAKEATANLAEEAKTAAREAVSTLAEEIKETAASMLSDARQALREATIGKAERMVNEFGDTAQGTSSNLMTTIRENPLPSAMVGIGLGLLWLNRRKPAGAPGYAARPYYGSAYPLGGSSSVASPYSTDRSEGGLGESMGAVQERAGELVGQAKDTAGEVVGQVKDTAGNLVNSAGGLVTDASGRAVELAGTAGSTARGASSTLWDNIQQNPVPAALAGMSIAWLVRSWNQSSPARSSYSGATDVTYAYPREHANDGEGQTRFIGQALTQVDQFGREVPGRAQQLVSDKPLVMGALALGLGAAAGLAVPNTEPERQLMGGPRDQLFEHTASVLRDTQERVQQAAAEAQQALRDDGSSQGGQDQKVA